MSERDTPTRVRVDGKTPAEAARDERKHMTTNRSVSPRECLAMRALSGDAWSYNEIAFAFERKAQTVAKHAQNKCNHDLPHAPAGATHD